MLSITCFTTFQAIRNGQELTRFRSTKERALLIYLAVEQERAHQRTTLAGLLWPDEPEERARHNLAQTLLNLRKAIGDSGATPPYLLISAQTIAFNPASDHQVDVITFVRHLTTGKPETQQKAIDLYRGPFLEGFSVAESDLLEHWILAQREHLHQLALAAFNTLRAHYESAGEFQQAQQLIRRLLVLAPWQEEAHCQLMRLLALTGERTMALAQYDTLSQILLDELGVPPAAETDRLYDQILAGEIGPATNNTKVTISSAMPTPTVPPFQALTASPYFVGRTGEIAQLQRGLTAAGAPIWAVVGMGGAGKSTLATQVCHRLRADFADGVLWANAATSTPLEILATWARAYGYDFSGLTDLASRAAAVRGLLAAKAVLIVLDNVLEASAVQPLLPGGVHNAVLLTTRDLDVAHALNAQALLLGELSPASSRLLLLRILGEERVQREEVAAAQIGALVHYLPLAVEIVAQRLRSRPRQPLAQMAARLGDAQQRLGLEISDRAVRASFEVSWAALDAEQRRAFTLAAIFAGRPFTATAIAYLAAADFADAEDWFYALEALSLVRAEGTAHYRQHPLLADFAHEKLVAAEAAYARMVDYYYGFAQENQHNYAVLAPEWGNLMAALAMAHRQKRWQMVVDYTAALTHPWFSQGRYAEARSAFCLTHDAALALNDEARLATNRLSWGEACLEQNDYDEANRHLAECLKLRTRLAEAKVIANAKYHLARIAIEQSQFDKAEQWLQECLASREQSGDRAGVAAIAYQQAVLCYSQDKFEDANRLCERALAYQKITQDKRALIPSLRLLAHTAINRQTPDLAQAYAQEALRLSEELEDVGELAVTLYTLTGIHRGKSDFSAAKHHAEAALPLLQRVGLRRIEGLLLYQLTVVYTELGDYPAAMAHALQSIDLLRSVGDNLNCAYALLRLGDLYQKFGQQEQSQSVWQEALATGQALEHPWLLDQLRQRLPETLRISVNMP